jgi:hypothetical protein
MSDQEMSDQAPEPNDGAALSHMLAERKIEQALMALGVSFADCVGLVVFDPKAETAYWTYQQQTGHESIHVGPSIAALPTNSIEMVLRHEILHRSLYNGFGERYEDKHLSNLTLDTCINRLLTEAYPEKMRALSESIYPEESKKTLVALPNCVANPSEPSLRELWISIWQKLPDGSLPILNPASLYFRLYRMGSSVECGCPFSKHTYEGQRDMNGRLGRAARAVATDISKHLPKSSSLGRAMSDYAVIPLQIGTSQVEDFLQRIRVRKIIDSTAKKILEPLQREIRVQPYPAFPSRLGLAYQLAGVSDAFLLYWNREVSNTGARMSIGFYMDVSGSMTDKFSLVAGFMSALKEYPLRVRVFDTEVRAVDVDEFSQGRIQGGGGTDFDPPILDFVEAKDTEAAVFFTDGEAPISDAVGKKLRASAKRLFVVYLLDSEQQLNSPLDRYAASSVTLLTKQS